MSAIAARQDNKVPMSGFSKLSLPAEINAPNSMKKRLSFGAFIITANPRVPAVQKKTSLTIFS